jgi:hypothetical protein
MTRQLIILFSKFYRDPLEGLGGETCGQTLLPHYAFIQCTKYKERMKTQVCY